MTGIDIIQDQIVEDFSILGQDAELSNIYLIELGQKLQLLDEDLKTEENIVKGCQSKVWLVSNLRDDKIYYQADSNTVITKGLVSLLVKVYSGQHPDDILSSNLYFIDKIGLHRFIGTQRSNGFAAMIKQMKLEALAHKTKINQAS
ncbi:MAG: SufE family protein [Cyclobacteriaceae bacterium]